MAITVYQCAFCQHFQGSFIKLDVSMPKGWRLIDQCAAFPDGIPEEIVESRINHSQPYSGDNGILFEAKSAEAGRLQALIFDRQINDAPHRSCLLPEL